MTIHVSDRHAITYMRELADQADNWEETKKWTQLADDYEDAWNKYAFSEEKYQELERVAMGRNADLLYYNALRVTINSKSKEEEPKRKRERNRDLLKTAAAMSELEIEDEEDSASSKRSKGNLEQAFEKATEKEREDLVADRHFKPEKARTIRVLCDNHLHCDPQYYAAWPVPTDLKCEGCNGPIIGVSLMWGL